METVMIDTVLKRLFDENSESSIRAAIDDVIPEYCYDYDPDEFDSVFEAYIEMGRGEAESHVIKELITSYFPEPLGNDTYIEVFREIQDYYSLETK